MSSHGYHAGIPGSTEAIESAERAVLWHGVDGMGGHYFKTINVDATAVDSGNSPTSLLRPGLVMGKLDATNQYVDYDPDATDGSQEAVGVLVEELYTLDPSTGSAADRMFRMLIHGGVKAGELVNLDYQARAQLVDKGIHFDDLENPRLDWKRVNTQASDYTIVAANNRHLFSTAGASGGVTFTLPAIAAGLTFYFLNLEDQNMTIASAEGDNLVAINDAEADSVAFSTSSEKVGALLGITALYDGSTLRWVPFNLSPGAHTVTPAS